MMTIVGECDTSRSATDDQKGCYTLVYRIIQNEDDNERMTQPPEPPAELIDEVDAITGQEFTRQINADFNSKWKRFDVASKKFAKLEEMIKRLEVFGCFNYKTAFSLR